MFAHSLNKEIPAPKVGRKPHILHKHVAILALRSFSLVCVVCDIHPLLHHTTEELLELRVMCDPGLHMCYHV